MLHIFIVGIRWPHLGGGSFSRSASQSLGSVRCRRGPTHEAHPSISHKKPWCFSCAAKILLLNVFVALPLFFWMFFWANQVEKSCAATFWMGNCQHFSWRGSPACLLARSTLALDCSKSVRQTSTRCFALRPSPPLCGLHRCPAMRRWQPLDARRKDSSAFQPATQQDRLLCQASLLSSLAPGRPARPTAMCWESPISFKICSRVRGSKQRHCTGVRWSTNGPAAPLFGRPGTAAQLFRNRLGCGVSVRGAKPLHWGRTTCPSSCTGHASRNYLPTYLPTCLCLTMFGSAASTCSPGVQNGDETSASQNHLVHPIRVRTQDLWTLCLQHWMLAPQLPEALAPQQWCWVSSQTPWQHQAVHLPNDSWTTVPWIHRP